LEKFAIIIAVNPADYLDRNEYNSYIREHGYEAYLRGGEYYEADRADIKAHKWFADNMGHTWWNVPARGRSIWWMNKVDVGYFSEPGKKVSWGFEVLEVKHY